jgi:hypothetical protein
MTEIHDRELGTALRELDVPGHRPDFDADLRRRLTQPAPRPRRWVLAAAAALAVAVAAIVALALPRGSGVASAAEVREAISNALGSAHTISGVFVNREQAGSGENRWRFEFRSSGSFRITGLGKNNPTEVEYDPGLNVEASSDIGLFVWRVGLAPGWPDSAPAGWVLRRDLGSVVAALAADPEAEVEEIEYAGREAWVLRTPSGNPGEEREITVDRGTGIPVRDRRLRDGRFAGEWRIEGLRVDAGTNETFRLQPRKGQQQTRYDMGFERMSLERAASVVGYEPLVPEWLPSGFELGDVSVARASRPTGDEQRQNPESRMVVSLRYQRGLDQIVVTTRLTGPDPSRWGDPVIGSSVHARTPVRLRFVKGALRDAVLVIDPNSVPHIWAIAGPLVVTLAGNVDGEELVRIAESLRATPRS